MKKSDHIREFKMVPGRSFHRIPVKYFHLLLPVVLLVLVPLLLRYLIWISVESQQEGRKESVESDEVRKVIAGEIQSLQVQLDRKTPVSYYLVINSAANTFSLYRGGELVKTDRCSTGSYVLLKNGDQQQWMFSTPKGEFRIQGKTTAPVWRRPDWAFVEEGLPVPPPFDPARYAYGVLGDYALSLGDGYLIHGTLYQRFLGLPVTHGCIRLNDENLELVYRSMKLGYRVYIY